MRTLRNNLNEQDKAKLRDLAFTRITDTLDKLDLSANDIALVLGLTTSYVHSIIDNYTELNELVQKYIGPKQTPKAVLKSVDTLKEYLQQFTTEEEKQNFLKGLV